VLGQTDVAAASENHGRVSISDVRENDGSLSIFFTAHDAIETAEQGTGAASIPRAEVRLFQQ